MCICPENDTACNNENKLVREMEDLSYSNESENEDEENMDVHFENWNNINASDVMEKKLVEKLAPYFANWGKHDNDSVMEQ